MYAYAKMNNSPISQQYMTNSELARLLKVHPVTITYMARKGRLPAEKVGNRWLIPRDFAEEFAKTYIPKVGRPRRKRK